MNERQALDLMMRTMQAPLTAIQDAGFVVKGKLEIVHPRNDDKRQIHFNAEINHDGLITIHIMTIQPNSILPDLL